MRAKWIPITVVALAVPALCAAQATTDLANGEATFRTICATCHTTAPPPKLAPPMAMVSQHYRDAFRTDAAGIEALTRFIAAPDTLRMTLPKHAQQRFGVMPRLPLSEQQVRDVAHYVWSLSAPAATPAAPAGAGPMRHRHGPPAR